MIETRTLWVSLVALKTRCVTRVDLRLRDSRCRSPKCDVEYCLPACTHLGQDPTGNHIFGAQSRSGFDSQSIPFTLATFLFTLQATTSANGAYTPPAKLDTGRVANTYPGGSHTRWSSNHFQSARAPCGSGSGGGYRFGNPEPVVSPFSITPNHRPRSHRQSQQIFRRTGAASGSLRHSSGISMPEAAD